MAERENTPTARSLIEIEAELAASEADSKAGRTVPLAPMLRRLRVSATRLEAQRRKKAPAKV